MDASLKEVIWDQVVDELSALSKDEVADSKDRETRYKGVETLVKLLDAEEERSCRIEVEKIRAEAEKEKAEAQRNTQSKLDKIRIAAEVAKVALTLATAFTGYWAYDKFQTRVLKFEETGRIVSTAGRDLKLPRFMK